MRNPDPEKITHRQIELYSIYMTYAMQGFAKEVESIKNSIKNAVMSDLKSKNPDMDQAAVEKQVQKIIDTKLSVMAKIDFEE